MNPNPFPWSVVPALLLALFGVGWVGYYFITEAPGVTAFLVLGGGAMALLNRAEARERARQAASAPRRNTAR